MNVKQSVTITAGKKRRKIYVNASEVVQIGKHWLTVDGVEIRLPWKIKNIKL